jgi:hypothetical protein
MASTMLDIMSCLSIWSYGYPHLRGWVNLKQFFDHITILPFNYAFGHTNVGQWGHFFFAQKGSTPKWKLTKHPSRKNTLIWRTKVGRWWLACLAHNWEQVAKLAKCPPEWPYLVANFSILYCIQSFSKTFIIGKNVKN